MEKYEKYEEYLKGFNETRTSSVDITKRGIQVGLNTPLSPELTIYEMFYGNNSLNKEEQKDLNKAIFENFHRNNENQETI